MMIEALGWYSFLEGSVVVERVESFQRMQQSAHHTCLLSLVENHVHLHCLLCCFLNRTYMCWHPHQHVCNLPLSSYLKHHTNGLHENRRRNAALYIHREFLIVRIYMEFNNVPLWLGGMVRGLQNGISSGHQVETSPLQSTHKSFVISVTTNCRLLVFRSCSGPGRCGRWTIVPLLAKYSAECAINGLKHHIPS